MSDKRVVLRQATTGDERFLLEVYASTRAQEMAMTDWSEQQKAAFVEMQFAAQQRYYQTEFPTADHRVILLDAQPIGRLYTAETEDELHILDVTLLPAHRNAGIGTPLIEDLLERAREAGKPVRIYVENFNPSLSLFKRLGFAPTHNDGLNVLLEWLPRA